MNHAYKLSALLFLYSWGTLSAQNLVLIRDVGVVSPERPGVSENQFVLIKNDRIAAITSTPPTTLPQGTITLEGKGRYLIPGLIDTHVHLDSIPGMTFPQKQQHPDLVAAYMKQLPRSYLYFGFTTLIDLNAVTRTAIDAVKAAPVHPDVYDCDCALALANGYPMNYIPETFRLDAYRNFIYDPQSDLSLPAHIKVQDHSPAAAVKRVAEAGGICVKTHYEPGFDGGPELPLPSKALMEQVLQESHRHGLPLLMHANSLRAHEFATSVGVDILVHGLWNWEPVPQQKELPPEVLNVMQSILDNQTGFTPTTRVIAGLKDLFNPSFLQDPHLAKVLPKEMTAWLQSPEGQWFNQSMRKRFAGMDDQRIQQIYKRLLDNGDRVVRHLAQKEGKLIFGSDTPSGPTYANPPGYNGYLEIQHLAYVGIGLQQLLAMLTLNSAEAYGLDKEVGSIQTGKVANLLLLSANPLTSAGAYNQIHTVIIRGKPINRNGLAAN